MWLDLSTYPFIVLYYGQFHSFSMLITEITLQCWTMHVRQYIYISPVLPYYGCHFNFRLSLISPRFHFTVCPRFLGIRFPSGLTVHTSLSS